LTIPEILSEAARFAIRDPENQVYGSAATAWEIVIKKTLGKLDAPDELAEVLRACQFSALSVSMEHALAVEKIPSHHRDPFDRILIAQSIIEGLTLITRDSDIFQYPISHLLA